MFRLEKNMSGDLEFRRMSRKMHPMFIDELMHMSQKHGKGHYGFLIALSFFKPDFPWVYDLGRDLVDTLKSKANKEIKGDAIREFREMLDFTLGHPAMRELFGLKKESLMFMKELPYMLNRYLDEVI